MKQRLVILAIILFGGAIGVHASWQTLAGGVDSIPPAQAYEEASQGKLILVDIRTTGEWRETGTPTVAKRISMHEEGFLDRLKDAVNGDKSARIALICATGVRSARLGATLGSHGFFNVVHVSEGMLGNADGTGWLDAGLPVESYRPFLEASERG